MGVTITDVARVSGVSTSTVSRVLSDNPRISEKTRIRVLQAVEDLGYRPHAAARSLANSASRTIGLILNTEAEQFVRNPFFIGAMAGISQIAQENDYDVMYAFNPAEKGELEIASRYVQGRTVDGIILFTSRAQDRCIAYLRQQNCPFSVIGRPDHAENTLWVDNDNFQASYQAADLLIARGHRQIAFIGGPDDLNMTKDRYDGYRRALAVHGIYPHPDHVMLDGVFTEAYGYDCMRTLLYLQKPGYMPPTAVITSDDLQGIGALQLLRERGRRDVAVIGFNNTGIGQYQSPALASIDINANDLGMHAARLLINRLRDEHMAENHVIVPTQLVERESLNVPAPSRQEYPSQEISP